MRKSYDERFNKWAADVRLAGQGFKRGSGHGRDKNKMIFLILGRKFLSGFAGAGWNYCFPGFNTLLAFSAPEDLARRCAFLCETNIEMRTLVAYCGWQKIDMETLETLETKYT